MAMTLTPSRLRVTQAKFFGDYNAGGSGVTNLTEGTGIDLTPNPLVNTGTISLQTPVIPAHGGTGANLSATGGAGQYVKQVGVGSNFTVGTIPYTDVGAGFVKVNGTTPLTADWPAGAWKITANRFSSSLLDVNTTVPMTAKVEFRNATTDTPDALGLDNTCHRTLAVMDGSNAVPAATNDFSTVFSRFDAAVRDPVGLTRPAFMFDVQKMGGSGGTANGFFQLSNVGGDRTIDAGNVGVTSWVWIEPFNPIIAPASWTQYAYWGVAARTQDRMRAVGMELDCDNMTADAFWSASVAFPPDGNANSTIGLALNCGGTNKNSVGLTFQGMGADIERWQTGIYLNKHAIEKYGIDAAGLYPSTPAMRLGDEQAIVARDEADTGDYLLITAKGTTNVSVGSLAGIALTSGGANTAVGNQALLSETTGGNNTAIGSNALANAHLATSNTAVGSLALSSNTSGNYNTAVGVNTLAHVTTNTDNTAIGYNAAHATTSGAITAVGSGALAANTSGGNNTAVGYHALQTVTTTSFSTAVGTAALAAATGGYNTAVGNGASLLNTSGTQNTAFGFEALRENLTGQSNIAIGSNAGRYETGSNAFYVNNQDRTNTAGDKALSLLYGIMAAAAANQKLTVNGLFKLGVIPAPYANNAAALAGGLLAGDLYTVTGTDPRQLAIVF